ncbi:hypothetical protein M011DRAFT_245964 [Sporormia fimetaria CBS 119925]|uniref:Rhodanese domain-containing protein n=1 Tax=Sporormia fimetaria CBS 119925 TaxID=1340428 RepID=A0A6A6V0A2_9PLEO|nr:hypothetical protein M011DRAFT_245964 [Sporormia fimetaria CBS 119925]
MGAIHLRIMGPQQADSVIKGIHKQDPAAFEDSKIMKADLVVFYCSLAQARSPAAADAYKKLRQELSKNKPLLKPAQKIVVLEGGIAAYSEVNGSKTKLTEWGKFPSKDIWEFKQVVPLKGDAEGNVKPNDTKRQTKMASTPGGDHDEHPEPNLSMGQSKRAPQPTGGRR